MVIVKPTDSSESLVAAAPPPSPTTEPFRPESGVAEEKVNQEDWSEKNEPTVGTCLSPTMAVLKAVYWSAQSRVLFLLGRMNCLRPEIDKGDEAWNDFPGQKVPPQWELKGPYSASGPSNYLADQSSGPSQPSVPSFTQRPDSGVGLRLEDDVSSQVSWVSTTTVISSVYDYYTVGVMKFPGGGLNVFRIDADMQQHTRTIHAFYKHIDSGILLPREVSDAKDVLDVATGAGDWALDVSDANPDATVFGTDLAAMQPHNIPDNVWFYVDDANSPYWGWDNRFNFVHMRGMNGAIKNWTATLQAAFRCLHHGGVIEISDMSYHPPGPIGPGSVWIDWFRMLAVLTNAAGLDIGIHQGDRAQRELRHLGYEVLRQPRDQYLVTAGISVYGGRCLLVGVVEQMKGILMRAMEFAPVSLSREELMSRLEREILQGGMTIRVERVFAQKPGGA